MLMLVSRRYERVSLIVLSKKPFSAWGEILGDHATAAALISLEASRPRKPSIMARATGDDVPPASLPYQRTRARLAQISARTRPRSAETALQTTCEGPLERPAPGSPELR